MKLCLFHSEPSQERSGKFFEGGILGDDLGTRSPIKTDWSRPFCMVPAAANRRFEPRGARKVGFFLERSFLWVAKNSSEWDEGVARQTMGDLELNAGGSEGGPCLGLGWAGIWMRLLRLVHTRAWI